MKKHFIYIILFGLLAVSCERDSKIALSRNSNDSLSHFLNRAADKTLENDQRKGNALQALEIVQSESNDSLNRSNFIKVANRLYNIDAAQEYKLVTQQLITRSTKAKDTLTLAKAFTYLGDYYADKYVSDSALIYYVAAEKLYRKLKNDSKVATMLLNKATLQLNEKDYVGSEKSAYEAVKFVRLINNPGLQYDAFNLLGIIHMELSEFDTSLEYHTKALEVTQLAGFEDASFYRSSTLNNLGVVHLHQSKYIDANRYFEEAAQSETLFQDNPVHFIHVKLNIHYSNLKLNNLQGLPESFYDLMKTSDSLNVATGMISTRLYLGEFFLGKKDTVKALKYTSDAYKIAKFHGIMRDVLLSLNQLSEIAPAQAAKFSKEYIRTSDSIQIAERQVRNKLGRIEYETDILAQEKEQLVEQRKTLLIISFAVILVATLVFVIRMQAAKNRELRLVQEQQRSNEEIYQLMISQQERVEKERQKEKKRIAQELHDGVLGKLFGTRMNLGILNDFRNDKETVFNRGNFIDDLKSIEQELREISHDLSKEQQAVSNNFVLMVTNFMQSQKTVCTADIYFKMDPTIKWEEVQNQSKINLYRILQESFQNINKHANATTVTVALTQLPEKITLEVEDNGIGFIYSKKRNGIGLKNMRERILQLSGEMEILTAVGRGTKLLFAFPSNLGE